MSDLSVIASPTLGGRGNLPICDLDSNKEITTHRITGARNDVILYFTSPPISATFSKTLAFTSSYNSGLSFSTWITASLPCPSFVSP